MGFRSNLEFIIAIIFLSLPLPTKLKDRRPLRRVIRSSRIPAFNSGGHTLERFCFPDIKLNSVLIIYYIIPHENRKNKYQKLYLDNMRNISDINFWTQKYGLLPMHLNHQIENGKYLMLNGGSKDFCIQINRQEDAETYYSDSWSTNTKTFISIDDDVARIYNWYDAKIEHFELIKIAEKPDLFYDHLSSQSFKTSIDAVPFIIDVFRQLRNLVGEKDPEEALNLLFKLLISIEEDYLKINPDLWNIVDVQVPSNFDYYIELLRQGVNSVKPNLDLILRHTAGVLFQEAHKEVIYFDPQIDLWGGFSNKIITKKDVYSSVHYTPSYLARTIVENCIKQLDLQKNSIKIFDPACGSSEFLIETLKQLKNRGFKGKVTILGWDTSSSAVCTSNFLLKYEQRTQWNDDKLTFKIRKVNDSLTEQWDNDCDLIIMNPPFVSWELLDKNSRNAVIQSLGSEFENGKPNQASAFFYKAAMALKKNGVLGCVLPSSILTSNSYSKLRDLIYEEFTLNIIAKLGNYVFENALTDVSFIIAEKSHSNKLPELIWTKNGKGFVEDALCDLRKKIFNNLPSIENKNYSIYTPANFPIVDNSWKIISARQDKFLKDIKRFEVDGLLTNVSSIFTVKQGIRTGNNRAFVLSLNDYDFIPENEKKFYRKVINNETISNGCIKLVNYVWYPYDTEGILIHNEEEFKSIAPISYDRLFNFKNILSTNRARKDVNTWWHLSEHRAWLRKKEIRLYSTEFGKAGSFAFDVEGEFVVERGCAWIPKKSFTMDDYFFYLSVFSSEIFNFLLSTYSKPIQSGYYLGQVYTKNIPIPSINYHEIKLTDPYNRLVELGKELSNGNQYVKQAINDILKIYYPNYSINEPR